MYALRVTLVFLGGSFWGVGVDDGLELLLGTVGVEARGRGAGCDGMEVRLGCVGVEALGGRTGGEGVRSKKFTTLVFSPMIPYFIILNVFTNNVSK